jgi:hypothetical protein
VCDADTADPSIVAGGGSYMDVSVAAIDQRSAVAVGSRDDVAAYWRAIRTLAMKQPAKL